MSAQMDQHPAKLCLCAYNRCADLGFEGTLGELEGAGSNRRHAVTWEGEGRGDVLPVLGLDPPEAPFLGWPPHPYRSVHVAMPAAGREI